MIVGLVIAACAVLAYSWSRPVAPSGGCSTSRSPAYRPTSWGFRDRPPLGLPPRRAVAGTAGDRAGRGMGCERDPDLVCVTGDLVSHPGARSALAQAPRRWESRSSSSATTTSRSRVTHSHGGRARRSRERGAPSRRDGVGAVRGPRVSIAGVDPASYAPRSNPSGTPNPRDSPIGCGSAPPPLPLPPSSSCCPSGAYHLILAGHCTPARSCSRSGRARHARTSAAPARSKAACPAPSGIMHVSPGTGTTFVPFRFFARPEVTELVLRAAARSGTDGRPLPHLDRHSCSYAADAAREIDGVRGLAEGARPRHHGVKVTENGGVRVVELHLAVDWGASVPTVGGGGADSAWPTISAAWRDLTPRRSTCSSTTSGRRRKAADVPRVAGLSRGTLRLAPLRLPRMRVVAVAGQQDGSKERWIERAEEECGEWGTIYYDDDGTCSGRCSTGLPACSPRGRPPGGPTI